MRSLRPRSGGGGGPGLFYVTPLSHLHVNLSEEPRNIKLDPRLPFPDSVGGIFPGPARQPLLKESIRVLHGFPSWRATMIDSFEHVDYGDNNNLNR